jgi:hypothetical protein
MQAVLGDNSQQPPRIIFFTAAQKLSQHFAVPAHDHTVKKCSLIANLNETMLDTHNIGGCMTDMLLTVLGMGQKPLQSVREIKSHMYMCLGISVQIRSRSLQTYKATMQYTLQSRYPHVHCSPVD